MNKVIEFLKEKPGTVSRYRRTRWESKVPPIYVCRRNGRKTVVLHK